MNITKSRPFIINEKLRLKEIYRVEYPKNSIRSQSIKNDTWGFGMNISK